MVFLYIFFIILSFHSSFCEEKKIVLISCCYNAAASIEKTLDSIFSQKYSNFRVVLVNDASTDNTKELIDMYIARISAASETPQCQVIHNNIRRRKLANLYTILHECDPDEIVFLLDGDDRLIHDNVLNYINAQYQDIAVWMTFGNYQNYPDNITTNWGIAEESYCAPVSNDVISQMLYRKKPFVYMHPRTFYAWLFHQVQLGDLITERISSFAGDFFPACNDLAMFFPMVELAGVHVKFIDEILYIRNVESALVGFKVDGTLQRKASHEIRRKKAYQPLKERPKPRLLSVSKNLLFIIDNIFLIQKEYQKFKVIGQCKKDSNMRMIIKNLAHSFDYCVISNKNDRSSIATINFENVMQLLEKTGCSIAFFNKKPECSLSLSNSVYVWKRSLNIYLPKVSTYIISLSEFVQFMSQNSEYKTINDLCYAYIQSFQYSTGLSIFF